MGCKRRGADNGSACRIRRNNGADTAGEHGWKADPDRVFLSYRYDTGNRKGDPGDLFEITVTNPYPSSYQSAVDRARRELDQNARPELSSRVEHMENYDVILLGYPIQWHTAPMAVDTFLESYDLNGKTVLPFCTSGGSSIEESIPDIRSLGQSRGASVGNGLTEFCGREQFNLSLIHI